MTANSLGAFSVKLSVASGSPITATSTGKAGKHLALPGSGGAQDLSNDPGGGQRWGSAYRSGPGENDLTGPRSDIGEVPSGAAPIGGVSAYDLEIFMFGNVPRARPRAHTSLSLAVGGVLVAAGAALAPAASAASPFAVNSILDAPDVKIDGTCATSTGACTLRAALMEANAASGAAVITFNIPGTGVQTIAPATKLPGLTNPAGITIDGYTEPGASANTDPLVSNAQIKVELKGKGPGTFDGLSITTPNNTIRGLAIYNFWKQISLTGDPADNNTLVGNYICTNAAGTFDIIGLTGRDRGSTQRLAGRQTSTTPMATRSAAAARTRATSSPATGAPASRSRTAATPTSTSSSATGSGRLPTGA
ncbi:MAG: hypothetical protein IPH03_08710 [Tetrasphaera sp.]|nr:hypothetical protein [Tetrasphaera sp.]